MWIWIHAEHKGDLVIWSQSIRGIYSQGNKMSQQGNGLSTFKPRNKESCLPNWEISYCRLLFSCILHNILWKEFIQSVINAQCMIDVV